MWKCQECGRKFRSVKNAMRAANNGCPGCGGVDIDVDVTCPNLKPAPKTQAVTLVAPDGRKATVETVHTGGFWCDINGERKWVEVYESRSN